VQRDVVALGAPDLDGDRSPAVGVAQDDGRAGLVGQVAVAPLHERQSGGQEVATHRRELVLVPRALPRLAVGGAFEQSGVHQFAQPLGRRGLGDADPGGEVVEPAGAVEGLPHEQHRGARSDDLHGAADGAAVVRLPRAAVRQGRIEGRGTGGHARILT
jgi:hypothetical protein